MADELDDSTLAAIASALGGCPGAEFQARLRRSLERSIAAMAATETSATAGTRAGAAAALIPYVMTQDIEPVIEFAKRVFGAEETQRGTGSAGGVHCELRIGDSALMLGGAVPGSPVKPRLLGLHVYVDDVDAAYRRAIDAGATSLGAPADRPYGERAGFVADRAGNHWYIATRQGPTYFAQEPRTVTPHLYVQRTADRTAADFVAFLQAAFGATVELRHDAEDRIAHAVLRIEGTAIELGEGTEPGPPAPAAFVLNVTDANAAYARALRAGATSLFAPAPQSFGGRMGGVADPWGNEWFIASAS